MRTDRHAQSARSAVDDRLAVERMGDRLAHLQLVEGRLLVVGGEHRLALGRADDDLEARIGFDLRQRVAEREVGQHLHVAGKQRRNGCCGVRDDAELCFLQHGRLAPVVGGLDQRDRRALGPVVEPERAGADRLFLVGLGRLRRHDHSVAPAHVVEERALRVLQRHLEASRADHLDGVDGRKQALLRIGRFFRSRPVEREFCVLCVEVRAVVKLDARAQLEGVGLAVLGNGPALCEPGHHFAARADPRQAFEDVGIEHFIDRCGGACRRIEMRWFEWHAEHDVGPGSIGRGARCKGQRGGGENGFPRLHEATPGFDGHKDETCRARSTSARSQMRY